MKVFTINEHGGHLGHVTCTIYINFLSHSLRRPHTKFGFDWQSGFREDYTFPGIILKHFRKDFQMLLEVNESEIIIIVVATIFPGTVVYC